MPPDSLIPKAGHLGIVEVLGVASHIFLKSPLLLTFLIAESPEKQLPWAWEAQLPGGMGRTQGTAWSQQVL